jgi:hypothetical protein
MEMDADVINAIFLTNKPVLAKLHLRGKLLSTKKWASSDGRHREREDEHCQNVARNVVSDGKAYHSQWKSCCCRLISYVSGSSPPCGQLTSSCFLQSSLSWISSRTFEYTETFSCHLSGTLWSRIAIHFGPLSSRTYKAALCKINDWSRSFVAGNVAWRDEPASIPEFPVDEGSLVNCTVGPLHRSFCANHSLTVSRPSLFKAARFLKANVRKWKL